MRKVQFALSAIEELIRFKTGNQKLAFKVFELLEDIQHSPFQGLGKPEALKGNYTGYWSRRINDEHRLIYRVTEELIIVHSCFGHY
ncbi:MAG: Txe/YoeB family addiction module toxin [Bacteroidetes bacterium]|nr:Txe/YoeB family addiction module toxin [Bacteroidota bacterium]MBS1540710.1 Txe/YoeB family addiction module toxin [Bacteroidota bacterium]